MILYIIILLLMLNCYAGAENTVPANFLIYRDLYIKTMNDIQPDIKDKTVIAGQIEQETCYSLKSKKCQSPTAELKNEVEYGFGFGQITVTKRFNVFDELKNRFKELNNQEWEDRYNPKYQMLALFLQDKYLYKLLTKYSLDEYNNFAFMLSAYNQGLYGVLKDIDICKKRCYCDYRVQFGNVEKTSRLAKNPSFYKKSFYEINREYVRNILTVRKSKYARYVD